MQIIPGSGGSFYCGNCLRDSKFVDALRKSGHEVAKIPMYLPLFASEKDLSPDIPVFYGAISIYLKQQFRLFRHAPGWVDKLLNSKPMLKVAAKFAGSTRAKGLEEMTVSMLMGEHGEQKEELERMVDWIAEHCKPDIIHLSNALLLGLAHRLSEKMNVPVVCSLQDEDQWVDVMHPSAMQRVWNLMSERGSDVAAFISVSDYYADEMKKQMHIPLEKLSSVHIGIYPEEYEFMLPSGKPRNIGYVSRMAEELGMGVVVDAFIQLKKDPDFADVKLLLTGGATGDDRTFLKTIRKKLHNAGLTHQVEFHEEFEEEGLKEFFKRVSVMSVPVLKGEAFGIYLLEAMASGIPVVQPALGAFPEIVDLSGGGRVYEPNTPLVLAEQLKRILSDVDAMDALALQARKGVEDHFHVDDQVRKMVDIYQKAMSG
jgi:glycosyltransferase involved in cell wall biosynthesis